MQMLKFIAPLVGLASYALAANGTTTTTIVTTEFVTYCPEPTVLVYKNKTITVVEPTTITITDCPCTLECYTPPPVLSTYTPTVPYANNTSVLPPVVVTVTPPATTSLKGVTYASTKTPVAGTTTPPVVGSTTAASPTVVVTAGANKMSGAAAFGLAIGMAALVL